MSTINRRLYEMRKYLNATQQEFGDTGGVSQSTQNRYEQPGTDVPVSYLDKIYSKYGSNFCEEWLYFGRGPMLRESSVSGYNRENPLDSGSDDPDATHLSRKEAQIIAEVKRFSDFLKKRPLNPEVKRHLLQLLIESIDQTLDELHEDDPADD